METNHIRLLKSPVSVTTEETGTHLSPGYLRHKAGVCLLLSLCAYLLDFLRLQFLHSN